MKWLTLLLIILFADGCRCKHETYYFTPTAGIYWTEFREGSYWVFQSAEDSADVDTLTLINRKLGLEFSYTETECDGRYFEEGSYQLVSAKTHDTISVDARASVTGDYCSWQGPYHSLRINAHLDIDKGNETFLAPGYDTITMHPTYGLGQTTYHNVVHLRQKNLFTSTIKPFATVYLFAPHVGLIAFEAIDNLTGVHRRFNLTAHRVVK